MSDSQIKIEYLLNSSEFNKNMASMKKNMQLCNEEVKNSAKEMNTYGSNIQTLTSRQKAIQQAMEQSKKIMAEYNFNLEKNKKLSFKICSKTGNHWLGTNNVFLLFNYRRGKREINF